MIRILHFISDSNIGGAGRLICNLISNMDLNKFETIVALPKGSALIAPLSSLPCEIIELDCAPDKSFCIKDVLKMRKVIKKTSPSIVHSHASLSSRIASLSLGIPSRIFTKHCSFGENTHSKLSFVTGALNNILSSSIIATSDSAKRELINMGCNEKKIKIITNGTEALPPLNENERKEIRKQYGFDEDNFIIGIFARLEKYKGHKTLISSAQICKKRYPKFRFLIVGDGSIMEELKEYAKLLDVDDIIKFTGFCENVSPLFNITDLNVNCSYLSETSSLSLCEGMSLGIPSVVSNCGGNPHMVKNEMNGLVFTKNDPSSLSRALIRLYSDKELYQKCSTLARKRYETEFSAKIMVENTMKLYCKEYKKQFT